MTIQKIMKKSSLIRSNNLGGRSFINEPTMRYTWQPIALQNSLLQVAAAANKSYKTT
jgi:hypothetical protein